ncbi:Poly-beta-1,6-N-acetyl-D-glucosamine synthase [Planctomycetes bacterium CA13]|uniref:Poly-beta-1,6-N-acetyl-D-glucosamine synthase n=1 Tax=Novipirellula herctigrandis TaxID=2527986 RepID=A0A5C5Z669_9BACT|nr:Poly-beta-1,6-N-acetyl-D-glucosamine synthase [Planctomycetes bacterium CA13]
MDTLFTFAFWGSVLCLAYAYAGYPMVVALLAKRCGDAVESAQREREDLPMITVLVAAYNAEQHLPKRIENILACDYPSDRLRILIASDGSTDRTVAIVHEFNDRRITAIDFVQRRGKSATMVDAVESIDSPVIVFTDVTTRFDSQSLNRLARHFANPDIGLVTGQVAIVDENGMPSESTYWKMEMMVRRCEAKLGIMLGTSGAIYAIRRSMFVTPTRPTINDDMVLPMLVHLTHRCQFVLDPSARAYATGGKDIRAEFDRRSRIGIGAFQCLPVMHELWRWKNRTTCAAFVSHKLLRWTGPFLLATAFVSNVHLFPHASYKWLFALQIFAYSAALYGFVSSPGTFFARFTRVASSFVVMNAAIGIGILRWMRHPDTVTWNPTSRSSWDAVAVANDSQSQKRAA